MLSEFLALLKPWWPLLAGTAGVLLDVACTIHAVLRKRDSRAVIAWVGLIWIAPFLGPFFYYLLGINRIERKAVSLKLRKAWRPDKLPPPTQLDLKHREELSRRFPNMLGQDVLVHKITGLPITPGNRIDILRHGDETFPAMLDAIRSATGSVHLLSYIFDTDATGELFLEELVRARDRGVEIRVLIDHVGSRYSRVSMVDRLRAHNIHAHAFLPTRRPRFIRYANLRNHRKILIVDGAKGFCGGTNIREGHWLSHQPADPVPCLHFRLEGPVVSHLQEIFAIDWAFTTGESLAGTAYFPEHGHAGAVWARAVPDGPDEDFEKMEDTLLGAIQAATRSIRIITPYFLPALPLMRSLCTAALRGVQVDIVLPEKNNIRLVQWAGAPLLQQCLAKGCRIFLSPPPFDHTKLMTVDGVWSFIGSTNWDDRSLRLNFECNVECYDDELAGKLCDLTDHRIRESRPLSLDELESRPFLIRVRDGLARLFTPYL